MKKLIQFLYFFAMLALILTLPAVEIPAMAQAGTSIGTPSDAEEELPEETVPEQTLPDGTVLEEAYPDNTVLEEAHPNHPNESDSSGSVSMPSAQIQDPSTAPAGIATGSDAEPREIIKVMTSNSDALILAERRSAGELLSTKLESRDYSTAAVLFNDRTRDFYPIQYDLDSLDLTQTGLFFLNGTVEVPDDVSIDPELAAVTLPVFLYDPETPCELPVRSSNPVRDSQLLLGQDSSFGELQKKLKYNNSTYLYFDDGIALQVPLTWDVSSVIFGTPGAYRIHGIPDLPEGILLSDEFSSFPCDIIIQDTGVFSLTPPIFDGISFFTCWAKPTPQLDKLRRYYAIGDDGAWKEDTTGKFMQIASHDTQLMSVLYFEDILFDVPYYFQLEYDGECSNILKVYITKDDVYYDLIEGDRDGGDRGEQPPPTVTLPSETVPEETQPADQEHTSHNSSSSGTSGKPARHSAASDFASGPGRQEALTASASPSPEASETVSAAALRPSPTKAAETADTVSAPDSTGQEADTADYTILSGRRIQKELELNPGRPVVFTKHRIRLEIPADTGLFSNMSDQSLLRAEIMSLADNRISVMLSMDGVPLTDLPSMTIMTITMPWKASNEKPILEVINENGEVLGTAAYLDSSITFQLSETGVFTIASQDSADAPAVVAQKAPFAPADGPAGDSVSAGLSSVGSSSVSSSSAGSSSAGPAVCVLLAGITVSIFLILHYRRRGGRNQT